MMDYYGLAIMTLAVVFACSGIWLHIWLNVVHGPTREQQVARLMRDAADQAYRKIAAEQEHYRRG